MTTSTATPEIVEAAIADARRHARRRRARNASAIVALAATAAVVSATVFEHGRSAGRSAPVATRPIPMHDGPLVILAGRARAQAGWYGVSRIAGNGRLRPFIRCPGRASWCGEPESVAWTTDGGRLALSVTSFGFPNPYNGIHVIDMSTHRDTQIRSCNVPRGECDWFDLAWSPDGKTLAYVSAGNIVLVDADGTNRRVLPAPPGRKSSPSWSPDGRQIVFAAASGRASSIYRIDADGGNVHLLARHAGAPAWSSGGVIAYHSDCGIRLMLPSGAAVIPRGALACGAIGLPHLAAPVWSPDGTKIAATLSRRLSDSSRGTYVMASDGTGVERVTTATLSVFVGQRPRVAWQPLP